MRNRHRALRAWLAAAPQWTHGDEGHHHHDETGGPWRGRRGGAAWGPFMGPGGPPSFAFAKAFATAGGRGPRGGRARRGDVRTAVLVLLDEQPQHGYQLITEFERRTDGRWKPSPGSVYPVLSQLTDEGLVRPEEVDGRKVFHLTDEGRAAAADARERHGERLWGDDEGAEWPPQPLMEAFVGLAGAAWQVAQAGDPNQIEHARAVIDDTRRVLYRILADEAPEA